METSIPPTSPITAFLREDDTEVSGEEIFDLRHQIEVMTVLRSIAASGRVVIVILHDRALAANWADHLVLLHDGRVAGMGEPDADDQSSL